MQETRYQTVQGASTKIKKSAADLNRIATSAVGVNKIWKKCSRPKHKIKKMQRT